MSRPPGPPYYGIEWDDALEQEPIAAEITTKGYLRVERWMAESSPTVVLTLGIMVGFHREIFQGLFPEFAGKLRGPKPQYLEYDSEFGNYRGESFSRVLPACESLFTVVGNVLNQLDALRLDVAPDEFDREVLKAVAYTHCELIRIHPFVNGNGRVARACVNYFAWRYSYYPVPFIREKGSTSTGIAPISRAMEYRGW